MKKTLKALAVIVGVFVVLFLFIPGYVKKAVWYWGPSIDDYKIFYNRVIKAGEYQPWEEAVNYNDFKIPDSIREVIEGYKPIAGIVIQNKNIIYEEYWDDAAFLLLD